MTDPIKIPTKSIGLGSLSTTLPAMPVLIPSRRTLLVITTYNNYLSRLKDTYLSKVSNALKIIEIRLRTWKI